MDRHKLLMAIKKEWEENIFPYFWLAAAFMLTFYYPLVLHRLPNLLAATWTAVFLYEFFKKLGATLIRSSERLRGVPKGLFSPKFTPLSPGTPREGKSPPADPLCRTRSNTQFLSPFMNNFTNSSILYPKHYIP